MSYPNIKLEQYPVEVYTEVGNQLVITKSSLPIEVSPRIKPFVEILASENPTWEFKPNSTDRHTESLTINNRYYSNVTKVEAIQFIVSAGSDQLGTIGVQGWGDRKFTVSNRRIREERERGSEYITKDIVKALKKVKATFHPKTEEEILQEKRNASMEKLARVERTHRMKFNDVFRAVERNMRGFVYEHLELFQQHTNDYKTTENYRELSDKAKDVNDFEADFDANKNVMVTIMNDTYLFTTRAKSLIAKQMRAEVDPEVVRMVGMLKLLEVGDYVSGIGIKCDDNSFIIKYMPNIVSQGEQA